MNQHNADWMRIKQCWCAWDELVAMTHDEFIDANNLPPHEAYSEWEDTFNKYGNDSRYQFLFYNPLDG